MTGRRATQPDFRETLADGRCGRTGRPPDFVRSGVCCRRLGGELGGSPRALRFFVIGLGHVIVIGLLIVVACVIVIAYVVVIALLFVIACVIVILIVVAHVLAVDGLS